MLGLMSCHCHLEILNSLEQEAPPFHLAGPHKLHSWAMTWWPPSWHLQIFIWVSSLQRGLFWFRLKLQPSPSLAHLYPMSGCIFPPDYSLSILVYIYYSVCYHAFYEGKGFCLFSSFYCPLQWFSKVQHTEQPYPISIAEWMSELTSWKMDWEV